MDEPSAATPAFAGGIHIVGGNTHLIVRGHRVTANGCFESFEDLIDLTPFPLRPAGNSTETA